MSYYITRQSKWQLQNVAEVLKIVELKCHFLCMVRNRLLFWAFINQRPSIFVSHHRQTKKDIHISLLSVPSPACVMYGWSVWIWVMGWVWKQVEAKEVIQSKLVSDTFISSQNGHLHHYPVTSSTLCGWNTVHLSQMTWGDSPSHFCTWQWVILHIKVMPMLQLSF